MNSAVILFHKNITRYPNSWISRCIGSIRDQSYENFDVYELEYGGNGTQHYVGSNFESLDLQNHSNAQNHLLDKVFSVGYDVVFNVNIDDFYSTFRFEKQIEAMEMGYDIVSSNFIRVDEDENPIEALYISNLDIEKEAANNRNILAHPAVCYSKYFWENCTKFNSSEIPKDDFMLWKRSFGKFKFHILPDFLLYQRIHNLNVSK